MVGCWGCGQQQGWRLVLGVWEKGCRSPGVLAAVGREDHVEFLFYF